MIDLHLHLPAGAQKKDGPSAGVAMVRNDMLSGDSVLIKAVWGDRSVLLYRS